MSVVVSDYSEYETLRLSVRQRIDAAPRGTQQEISYDLRVPATRISQVLSGQFLDERLLHQIDDWIGHRLRATA